MSTIAGELSRTELEERITQLPRIRLAHLPTPLEELPRFGESLGGPRVWIKRDDCTGLAFGGNKTRHNEFILGQAVERGAEVLVWGAGVQSNNCRQTAAACAKLGLEIHLILSTAGHPPHVQGNLLLDYLLGATVELTDAPLGDALWDQIRQRAGKYQAQGKEVLAITDTEARTAAAASYVLALCELAGQLEEQDTVPEAIYFSSAGTTGAGLFLGRKILGLPCAMRAVMPILWEFDTPKYIAHFSNLTSELIDSSVRLEPEEIDATPEFIGEGYGIPTPEGIEAIRLMAQTEGILLDPVYSAKAMAALIADIRAGKWQAGQNVVFVHTGGTPALFAYHRELGSEFGALRKQAEW